MQGHSNIPGLNVGNVRCAALCGPSTLPCVEVQLKEERSSQEEMGFPRVSRR